MHKRPRRAILFTPGDNEHKIQFAATLEVDAVCFDLDSSVVPSRKIDARYLTAQALRTLDLGGSERLVRINPVKTLDAESDLLAILPAHPDGIVVPQVENAAQLQWVSRKITTFEEANGWQLGGIHLLAALESAQAIINLQAICRADARLVALLLGAEDLALNIGAVRTRAAWELLYARSAIVLHAAAFDLQAIDMANSDFHDLAGLRQEARRGAELGFLGKQVLHPDQVAPVQEIFTPDQETIAEAENLLDLYQQQHAEGVGQFELDGIIVDAQLIRSAEGLLARAEAAGIYVPRVDPVEDEPGNGLKGNWLQQLWAWCRRGENGQGG
jgi:citrate lyase beta subunit